MNPPDTSSYFSFFGLPVSLSVDQQILRKAFLENSRRFHPDFHTLSAADEQDRALELSSLNNEAFKVLSDTDSRIRYVLELKGLLGSDSKEEKLPQAFLMEMMDLNEQIMDMQMEPSAEALEKAQNAAEALEKEIESGVAGLLQQWNDATGTIDDLNAVRDYFHKKRYLLRVKENLTTFASDF
ncbi:MAG: Fe-S protein assembly co-chaperone HscB [Saprospiraceae bacterium]|jgi:molecular chaperone HscB|nr:Fe-S protein assembly co-chaperone HscB [Saprospiraceae bacterium]